MENINIKNIRNAISLPNNLHYILIGLMLGDGSISKSSPTSNSRFEMSFGSNYKQFAESIGKLFNDYINTPVKAIKVKGNNMTYTNYRLKTVSLPLFNKYYDMFYRFNEEKNKNLKIIPHNISESLNPIVLAYLLMSDGNFDKNRNRVRIYTNNFTKEEVKILAESINRKLNIYTGVLHDRKNQWILTIGKKQLLILRNIVTPHFEPSMLYRIGL
uniref:LAGLIDADG endonuclease type 2 n=1 Tax=Amanita thiersii TaxID=235537 RepID=A0A5Q0N2C6_9AGAR|nr:LAGLIDADG endonuclease type 2 [Amanita thiersii]QFZ98714.1 LAGLIDADG endonuclease type 2 [Amanita thiersii]